MGMYRCVRVKIEQLQAHTIDIPEPAVLGCRRRMMCPGMGCGVHSVDCK